MKTERKFMKGCEAVAEAAIRAGCRFYAGYPITPQNEIGEYFSNALPEKKGVFIQAESEIASINMVYGAASTGTRSMTSSSGPGISLMAEGISNLAAARFPAVIINVMRAGPGAGTIQPAQSDYLQATKALGHGGFRCIVYAPSTVQEMADYTYKAFQIAFRDRNPVIVAPDGFLGAIMEPVTFMPEYDTSNDNISWALSGCKGRERYVYVPGSFIDTNWEKANMEMAKLYEKWTLKDIEVEEYQIEDAEYVFAAYGTSARVCKTAVRTLRAEGIKAGLIRPITLYPFPKESFRKLEPSKTKYIIDVEMAIPAQMAEDVHSSVDGIPVECILSSGGKIVEVNNILDKVRILKRQGK